MTAQARVLLNRDCEGPTVCNDNALEIAEECAVAGVFRQLSRFDDYTAYYRKRPHYNAGDTLRLLLPFLKAQGMTESRFRAWMKLHPVQWVPDAYDGHLYLKGLGMDIFEISASYRPFALDVAAGLGIPASHVYCTDFPLDRFEMGGSELLRLQQLIKEITEQPELPELRFSVADEAIEPDKKSMEVFNRLEALVWGEMLTELPCSRTLLSTVRAMGGSEKTNAIYDTIARSRISVEATVYVGDSITDRDAFEQLNRDGGVTLSFNGNRYAVESAQYACWGNTSAIVTLLIAVLYYKGRSRLDRLFEGGNEEVLSVAGELSLTELRERLMTTEFGIDAGRNRTAAIERSDLCRRALRGDVTASQS